MSDLLELAEPHWTDRQAGETLSGYVGRLYDSIPETGWPKFDAKVRECEEAGEPIPPMIETLWFIRQVEEAEHAAALRARAQGVGHDH